jgi:hypothetical protein
MKVERKEERKEEKGTQLVASRNEFSDGRVKLHRRSHGRVSRSVVVCAGKEREMVRSEVVAGMLTLC